MRIIKPITPQVYQAKPKPLLYVYVTRSCTCYEMKPFAVKGFEAEKHLMIVATHKTRVYTRTPDFKKAKFQRALEPRQALCLLLPADTIVKIARVDVGHTILSDNGDTGPLELQGPGQAAE